jgi:hypothetical protein
MIIYKYKVNTHELKGEVKMKEHNINLTEIAHLAQNKLPK